MTSGLSGGPGVTAVSRAAPSVAPMPQDACLLSFHRLRMRPGARLGDTRLLITDPRRLRRDHPGLVHVAVAICGSRRSRGLAMPPSAVDRQVVAFWRDESEYRAFLDGPVMARWRRNASVHSSLLHPIAARGTWDGRRLVELPGGGAGANPGGPVAVLTYGRLPLRVLPAWFGRVVPRVAAELRGAPGLLAATAGSDPLVRITFTLSVWADSRAMTRAIYSPDSAHGARLAWGRTHLPETMFVRCRVREHDGLWDGHDPLAGVPAHSPRGAA